MSDSGDDLIDWRSGWLLEHSGDHVELLVPIGGVLPDDDDGVYNDVEEELRAITGARSLSVVPVDPYTGAGGYGLASIWEFASRGADLIAWVVAANAVAPKIRAAADFLAKRFSDQEPRQVFYSADAIKVLCVAEVCESGIDPRSITAINLVEHKYHPAEPTIEKQQFYSAYTVTISSIQPSGHFRVWNFFVTCQGRVVTNGHLDIPMPNATQWEGSSLPPSRLNGLP